MNETNVVPIQFGRHSMAPFIDKMHEWINWSMMMCACGVNNVQIKFSKFILIHILVNLTGSRTYEDYQEGR